MIYTIAMLSERWHLSVRTIERHVNSGRLAYINMGTCKRRIVRIPESSVLDFECRFLQIDTRLVATRPTVTGPKKRHF